MYVDILVSSEKFEFLFRTDEIIARSRNLVKAFFEKNPIILI